MALEKEIGETPTPNDGRLRVSVFERIVRQLGQGRYPSREPTSPSGEPSDGRTSPVDYRRINGCYSILCSDVGHSAGELAQNLASTAPVVKREARRIASSFGVTPINSLSLSIAWPFLPSNCTRHLASNLSAAQSPGVPFVTCNYGAMCNARGMIKTKEGKRHRCPRSVAPPATA